MSDAATQARGEGRKDPSPDVHPPKAIARSATKKGAKKASLDIPVLVVLGLLAGTYIAFGGLFATVAQAGAQGAMPFGARRCWRARCSRSV